MTTSDLSDDQRDLIVGICKFLQELSSSKSIDSDAIEVAVQCIGEATNVEICKPCGRFIPPLIDVFRTGMSVINSHNGHPDGFDKFLKALKDKGFFEGHSEGSPEYQIRLQRAKEKFFDKFGHPATSVSAEQVEKSEQLKIEGNRCLSEGDYQEAVDAYTRAIALNPTNAILFANRAAACSKLGNHQQTITDCQRAIELDYNYTKAHYRCGMAYSHLKQKSKARDCFNQALTTCNDRSSPLALEIQSALAALDIASPTAPSAAFDMNALFNNPMMQQMMQNPELINGMLGNAFGGADSEVNPMKLLSDPAAFRKFMNSPAVQAYEHDEELGPVIEDLRTNGVGAIMKHMSNPRLVAKISGLMKINDQAQ